LTATEMHEAVRDVTGTKSKRCGLSTDLLRMRVQTSLFADILWIPSNESLYSLPYRCFHLQWISRH